MRWLVLILVLSLGQVSAQETGTLAATLAVDTPAPFNGTGLVTFDVTLTATNVLCPGSGTVTVPLEAASAFGLIMRPESMTFALPADQGRDYSATQTATVALDAQQPGSGTALRLTAGPPSIDCQAIGGVSSTGDEVIVDLSWRAATPEGPELLMPGPGLGVLLVVFAVFSLVTRK